MKTKPKTTVLDAMTGLTIGHIKWKGRQEKLPRSFTIVRADQWRQMASVRENVPQEVQKSVRKTAGSEVKCAPSRRK